MASKVEDEDFVWVSIETATNPAKVGGTVDVFRDYWWTVDAERQAIPFYNPKGRGGRRVQHGWGSPQGNLNRQISERITASIWKGRMVVRQIPEVFVKHDQRDYDMSGDW